MKLFSSLSSGPRSVWLAVKHGTQLLQSCNSLMCVCEPTNVFAVQLSWPRGRFGVVKGRELGVKS